MENRQSKALGSLKTKNGFSLVEVLVVVGIMGVTMLLMLNLMSGQMKSTNYLAFQLKRTQLQNVLLGQFLNDPNNCACLFSGAAPFPANPSAPGATLTGVSPTEIGRYNFVTPGNCATATVPQPLVNNVGIDGIRSTSIQLTNIMRIAGIYSGQLVVNLQSVKEVSGPQDLSLQIPVIVNTTPAGANENFQSCALGGASDAILADPGSATFPNGLIVKWGTFLVTNDGPGGWVNFVNPFPNATFTVQVQSPGGNGNGQDNSATALNWNQNGFRWTNARDNFPIQGTYFATGH